MKKITIIILILIATITIGCQKSVTNLVLEDPKPTNVNGHIVSHKEKDIEISFSRTVLDQIYIKINNSSENTVKVLWNEATFVDTDGSTSKLVLMNKKYPNSDYTKDISPTVLPPASKFETKVKPLERINHKQEAQIIPYSDEKYNNKHIKIYLPLLVNQERKDLTFDFRVEITTENL